MRLLGDTNIDFMKYRKFWISDLAGPDRGRSSSPSSSSDFNLGIDFAGGTQLTLRFRDRPQIDELRSLLAAAGLGDAEIQRFDQETANEVIDQDRRRQGNGGGEPRAGGERPQPPLQPGSRPARSISTGRAPTTSCSCSAAADPDGDLAGGAGRRRGASPYGGDGRRADQGAAQGRPLPRLERGGPHAGPSAGGAGGAASQGAFLGDYAVLGVENVGPQIGKELRRAGLLGGGRCRCSACWPTSASASSCASASAR